MRNHDSRPGSGFGMGFTLVETLVCMAILGILAAVAYPMFLAYLSDIRASVAISDLKNLEGEITLYIAEYGHPPDSLADIGQDTLRDPWGNPYQYLRLEGNTTPGINGKRRKDKKLNPVNTDFDLYSNGPDGKTAAQFAAKHARDDVVRANNGRYFGLAADHIPL
ncbi:MAG: prepilin-type N-terminal cleavage/methylation domain-containing protein [Deltaproteobacteria bacterium]|nr:prepilin-type N-terminal cleavage/methylation domain-containing protein [Deltaproteobacteria bacterium]